MFIKQTNLFLHIARFIAINLPVSFLIYLDRNAEARLLESSNSNYGELAVALAYEIANPAKPINSRTMASIYFKNTLNAKSVANQIELHTRWKQLDPKQRNVIKETLLQAMTSTAGTSADASATANTEGARRFAAIAASEVACVELPYQEWPQFLPTITAACTNSNNKGTDAANALTANIQLAAYECLGLTCERIEEVRNMVDDVPDLPEPTVNAMLTTIVQGITQPSISASGENSAGSNSAHEIQYMALNALNKSLQFVHSNMERKDERDFIIAHAICGIASQHNDGRIRQLAYQCLDVIASEYYGKLLDYMAQIFQLTVNAIQTDPVEVVKIAAIEFWCTIAETESALLAEEEFNTSDSPSLCNKYVESAVSMLMPLLLDTLSSTIRGNAATGAAVDVDDEFDEDEYDIRQAGGTCIENFALTIGDSIVPLVMPFVLQNIGNTQQHWSIRDAAIVAFSCILGGGPSTAILGPFVHQSISFLLNAFNDPHPLIRDDATYCISNICREHIAVVQPDQVHVIVQGCIMKLQESPKLAARGATAIFHLSTSIKSPDATMPETNVLSLPMLPLLQALLNAMDRNDSMEYNLRMSAGAAASELITASAIDVQSILRDLLPAIMSRIDIACKTDVHNAEDREMKEQLLGLLIGLSTSLYQRLQKVDVLPRCDQMMNLLLQVLQVPNANCHEEALRAIGAIATALDEDFNVRCVCMFCVYLSLGFLLYTLSKTLDIH